VFVAEINANLRRPTFLFAIFGFFVFTHGLDRVLSGNTGDFSAVSSSIMVQAVSLAIIGVSALGLLCSRTVERPSLTVVFCIAFAALILASTLWSIDPGLTFRRAVSYVGVLVFGWFVYRALGPQTVMQALTVFAAAFVLLNAAIAVTLPEYGYHSSVETIEALNIAEHSGRFRGYYFHKNETARFGALALLLLLVSPSLFSRRIVWFVLIGTAILLLVAAQSSKVFVALPVAFLLWWFLRLPLATVPKLACIAWTTVLAVIVTRLDASSTIAERILAVLGRDLTLSGRDTLWRIGLELFQERWVWGRGYDVGWSQSARDALSSLKGDSAVVNHAHNGYLQLGLDLGVVGLILALLPVLMLLRCLLAPTRRWDAVRNFAALYFGMFVTLNLSGSYIHANNDLYPLLIIWLAIMLRQRSDDVPPPTASTRQGGFARVHLGGR
jgi:exopolysaccharide production protein ExoQ